MAKLGLVTSQDVSTLTAIDQQLIPLFEKQGVVVDVLVWDDRHVQWSLYDGLILRSVWDYHLKSQLFLKWLDHLDDLQIPLLNPSDLVRINSHKFYLKTLEDHGYSIVPTEFVSKTENFQIPEDILTKWSKAVIKPAVSASAYLTKSFNTDDISQIESEYRVHAKHRDFLVQKFMSEVQTVGELSMLFFNRKYAHTVMKRAKKGEFRVQEEYGGVTTLYSPSDRIIQQAADILLYFEGPILQARVDGIIKDGNFVLMEIELIEPHLFLEFRKESLQLYIDEAMTLLFS
jgi:hypothetical protein